MTRKALVVGIDYYSKVGCLHGCVNDSFAVKSMLDRNADGSINFSVRHLPISSASESIDRDRLRKCVQELFSGEGEVSLFYFAGHGHIEATGGYLCSSEVSSGHDGLALAEIMTFANQSKIQNRVIILDSCHSGVAGGSALHQQIAEISDGVTILTASAADQYAEEENGEGIFTSLLVDALSGAASNLVGDITPGGVYAHVDQSLGPWSQRPIFKTNIRRFISLRKVQPALQLYDLRSIAKLFPTAGFELRLDPSYEPERHPTWKAEPGGIPAPDPDKNAQFALLQKFNRVGLVVPRDAPHMWHAAMESKTVCLTALGEHYRRLAEKNLI
jgi:Caspase domain